MYLEITGGIVVLYEHSGRIPILFWEITLRSKCARG